MVNVEVKQKVVFNENFTLQICTLLTWVDVFFTIRGRECIVFLPFSSEPHLSLRWSYHVYCGSLCSSAVIRQSLRASPPEWGVTTAWGAGIKQGFGVSLSNVENWGRNKDKGDSRKRKNKSLSHEWLKPPQSLSKSDTRHEPEGWNSNERGVLDESGDMKPSAASFQIILADLLCILLPCISSSAPERCCIQHL